MRTTIEFYEQYIRKIQISILTQSATSGDSSTKPRRTILKTRMNVSLLYGQINLLHAYVEDEDLLLLTYQNSLCF